MGKVKEWLIKQQENNMNEDDIDALWHQKELEEQHKLLLVEPPFNNDSEANSNP